MQLHKHRERCIDYRRMFSIHGQSRHARQKKKENRAVMKGSIQPQRETWAEPLSFAMSKSRREDTAAKIVVGQAMLPKEDGGIGANKSTIMGMTENATRALHKTMPLHITNKRLHPLQKRGFAILASKRMIKRPKAERIDESMMMDAKQMGSWETKQFRTSIPWIPKSVGMRLVMPHQAHNLKATYFLATAFLGGMLSRADEKRPVGWFSRMKLPRCSELPKDVQEHLANASKIVCSKLTQDVTTLNAQQLSPWKKALSSFLVLWKSLFAHAGSKMVRPLKAMPVLLMSCNESMYHVVNRLLFEVWNETLVQFTTKENRYRGIKSRPKWDGLEKVEYRCVGEIGGFGVNAPQPPQKGDAVTANSVKAANLQDYLEQVTQLRFCSEFLEMSNRDAEEYQDSSLKRKEKAKKARGGSKKGKNESDLSPAEQQRQGLEAFVQSTWSEDAEVRSICKHVGMLIQSLDGKDAHLQAMTVVSQLMLAAWRGMQPIFQASAETALNNIDAKHIAEQTLPPPKPANADDGLNTQNFTLLAHSYQFDGAAKSAEIINAAPTAILALVCRLQANFKGHMMRTRHLGRTKVILNYCKDINWPGLPGDEGAEDGGASLDAMTSRASRKTDDMKTLDEKIATYQPKVSPYLGGPQAGQEAGALDGKKPLKKPGQGRAEASAAEEAAAAKAGNLQKLEDLPQVRITADHRACADLFAVYLYNMYRRKEMSRIWKSLSFGYDTSIKNFASLLEKNASLKPMVDSVSAQLKRGKAVGFSKAYVPKVSTYLY